MSGVRYAVQVLLPEAVWLDGLALYDRLHAWRGDLRLVAIAPDVAFELPTDDLPLAIHLVRTKPEAYADKLIDALAWSAGWHERWDETAARCPHSVVLTMSSLRRVSHASLLLSFLAVLDVFLWSLDEEVRAGCVLHWMPAKQLLSFARYCQLRTEMGPCGPAVNIRIANATGQPGELTADTVGLAELGLPDLQTVFTGKDPLEVVVRLRQYVRSVFVGDRLDCTWIEDSALVPPARDALTLLLD